jgi:hypothetical protein
MTKSELRKKRQEYAEQQGYKSYKEIKEEERALRPKTEIKQTMPRTQSTQNPQPNNNLWNEVKSRASQMLQQASQFSSTATRVGGTANALRTIMQPAINTIKNDASNVISGMKKDAQNKKEITDSLTEQDKLLIEKRTADYVKKEEMNEKTARQRATAEILQEKGTTVDGRPIDQRLLEKYDSFMGSETKKALTESETAKKVSNVADDFHDVVAMGSLGGLTDTIGGILKYGTSEGAYQANLGEEKDAKSIASDFISAISALKGNYNATIANDIVNDLKDKTDNNKIKEILNDDQTTWYNKILKIVEDSAVKAKDKIPVVKAMNSLIQFAGKINNNLDEAFLTTNKGINKATDFIDTGIQKELEDSSELVKFGNQAVRSAVGSVSSGTIGTVTGTGMTPMYMSTAGNSSAQKIKANETDADWFAKYEETRASANREGMTEILWEKLGDGLETLGEARKVAGGAEVTKLDDLKNTFIKYVGKKIDNQTTKKLVTKTLSNVLGIGEEIVEEIGTDLTNFAFDKASDENATYTWEDLKNTIFTTIASVGLANATTRLAGGTSEATKIYNDLTYEEAIEKIDNSNLDENKKNALKFACKLVNNDFQDIKADEIDESISLMQGQEKNAETAEKQGATIENKPLLKQEQQTTLPEGETAEIETSQEIEKNEENQEQVEQNVEKSEQKNENSNEYVEIVDGKAYNKDTSYYKNSKKYVDAENKIKEIEKEIEKIKNVEKKTSTKNKREISDDEVAKFVVDELGLEGDFNSIQESEKQMYRDMYSETLDEVDEILNDDNIDYKKIEKLEKELDKHRTTIRKIQKQEFKKQFENKDVSLGKETSKQEFEGFETKTTIPHYDEMLSDNENAKSKGYSYVKVVEMTPLEYLNACSKYAWETPVQDGIDFAEQDKISRYADDMKKGDKFPMPVLDLKDHTQEGRHRALTAQKNGIKTIPVLIVSDSDVKGVKNEQERVYNGNNKNVEEKIQPTTIENSTGNTQTKELDRLLLQNKEGNSGSGGTNLRNNAEYFNTENSQDEGSILLPENTLPTKQNEPQLLKAEKFDEDIQAQEKDNVVEVDGEQVEIPKTEAGEKPSKKTINTLKRILSKPLSKLTKKQKTSTFLATALVDTGAVFENMDLKRGSRDLQSKQQQHITYGKKLNNAIANKRSVKDSKGKEYKSKSLAEIVNEIGENSLEFDDYAKNLLNIDRMSIEENAQKEIKRNEEILDKIEEYREGTVNFDELVELVYGKNANILDGNYKTQGQMLNAQDKAIDKLEKELRTKNSKLSSLKNLPVFDSLVEETKKDKNGKEKKTYRAVTAEESKEKVAIYEQLHPEFKEYIQDVYDFLKVNRVEMVNAGVISQESSDYFEEKYPHYIPIDRALKGGLAVDVKLLDTNAESTIKKAKGGKGEMQPLLTTLANRTNQMYRATTRNELGQEIYKALSELGEINAIEESEIDQNDAEIELDEEMLERETIYEDLLHKAEKNAIPTMTIYRNGKKVTFEINEDIYQALKKSTFGEVFEDTKLSKAIQKTNDVRRKLITEWNPIFAVANGVKDIQDIFLNSQHSFKTYQKIPEAIAQLTSKGVWYQEFIEAYGLDTSYFKDGDFENLDKLNKKGILPENFTAVDILKLPVDAISTANHVIEMAPRLAEYIASREMGRTKEQSALDASRVTTNFSAGGNVTKVLNRNGFTFLNATVQGLNQQVRNVREAKAKGLKGMALLTMKYSLAGVLPVVLSNLIWGDDEEYEELSEYIKDNYYIIGKIDEEDKAKMPDWLKEFVGENNFIRIPKGRAVSATQKIVKEIGQYMTNDKQLSLDNVVNDFFETLGFVWDAVGVANPSENNLLSPMVDVLENEAWYGDDLVSSRLQKEDIRNRTDSSVDVISNYAGKLLDSNAVTRGVAERLNLNPITINYLLDQYSGAVGDMLLPFLTPAEENNPLLDKFATSSTMKSKYSNEYYTQTTQGKVGEPETLYDRANKSNAKDSDKVQYAYLNSFSKEINELYAEKSEILSSNTNNKQRKVAEIQSKINDLMKEGLDNLDTLELDEANGTATIGGKEYYKAKTKNGDEWTRVEDDDKPKDLSLNNYAKYKNDIYDLTQEKRRKENKENATLNNTEKIEYLVNSGFHTSTKKKIYESQIGEDDSIYNNLSAISPRININSYLDFKLQDFSNEDDPDSNIKGKTISGTGKKEKLNYIRSSGFSDIEKLYLRGISYKGELSNKERETLYNHIINTVPLAKQKDVIVKLKDYVELENGGWGRKK